MTNRMAKLDRALTLVHLLCDSNEGLTLDEMALALGVNRRTVERLRDIVAIHFDLVEENDGRAKRFRIGDALRRVFTRPSAAEIAALQSVIDAGQHSGTPQTVLLVSLLGKIRGVLDDREKRRIDPDLEALVRLQRSLVSAGPQVDVEPEALAAVQSAILTGSCLEFDYRADGTSRSAWRRVIPYGLVHGPVTYLIGKLPGRDEPPVPYRLDRMSNPHSGNLLGCPPEDWNLDAWLQQSFGIWREEDHDIVLRARATAVDRARGWRFHPTQVLEDEGDELIIRFRSGGLRELAEHLFAWGGDIIIDAPQALEDVMRERLTAVAKTLRPKLSPQSGSRTS